jgi:hypothetical protein
MWDLHSHFIKYLKKTSHSETGLKSISLIDYRHSNGHYLPIDSSNLKMKYAIDSTSPVSLCEVFFKYLMKCE